MASTETQHTNRLIHSSSPYLLQHAHNPVDWYEWGNEAFRAAREQGKLIFLSVGYSTCYWCHVMERECFENEAIAQVMNEHYINIKVDREERPDVDDIYMTAVQLITRQGGWPMSVWLEPQSLKPVVGGTYFPPQDSFGRPGFPSVLNQLAEAWRNQREQVLKQADQIAEAVAQVQSQAPPLVPLGCEQVEQAVAMLMRQYDRNHGGFSGAPKFPTPVNLDLLIRAAWDRDDVRDAVTHTLNRMATGGMYDQIGGGFHRYSVDDKWLVPHFEKMLYDNGQLAVSYAKAFELTGDAFYERVVRRTLEYVLREMTDDSSGGGAFYSAQDAEVDAREGLNYLWTTDEVRDVLKHAGLHDEIDFALEVYGLTRGRNFRDPHHPDDEPKNVIYLIDRPDTLASSLGISTKELLTRLDRVNDILLAARNKREQPRLDDKIITGWNGLMIAGFAEVGRVLNELRFIEAARRAARFVLKHMRIDDGELCRTIRRGKPGPAGFLDDYAYFIRGLLALYRATDERDFLEHAIELTDAARDRFADERGGYFDTIAEQSDLFVRTKGHYDGATPCGNSVMMLNLIELADRTGDERYLEEAARSLRAFSGFISQQPTGLTVSVRALHEIVEREPDLVKGSETQAGADSERSPVTVSIETDVIQFDGSGTVGMEVVITIDDGYHINAHHPGEDGLVPLTVEVDGDVDATPHYPNGERLAAAYADQPVLVHAGQVRVPVTMKRIGEVSEQLQVLVTYQACTHVACLAPRTEVVTLRIEPDR